MATIAAFHFRHLRGMLAIWRHLTAIPSAPTSLYGRVRVYVEVIVS
jgi:hypothetical protein